MKLNLICDGEFGFGHGQVPDKHTYKQLHMKLNLTCDGVFGLGHGQVPDKQTDKQTATQEAESHL